jgi:large repetitive protein
MTKKKKLSVFLIVILCLSGLSGLELRAQVSIPRDGFPYCEPFTNSTPRANTVFDGVPNKAILTSGGVDPNGNGVLRLTNNDQDQRGWVFVDLPFSSAYGIKTSFEYFAYGPQSPGNPADGLSFFLFDGSIVANDNTPPLNPNEFEIGGLGGSLGYSPLRYSGGNFGGGYGLKGAYMGIGLDARGNWGNQYEGKLGGFGNPFQYGSGLAPGNPLFPRYPNSIAIRGPVIAADVVRDNGMTGLGTGSPATFPDPPTYLSYPFIDGKILNNDPSDPFPFTGLPANFFLPSSQRFTVGAPSRITDCAINGYRKVFIDLKPNGVGSFTISMSMLITTASGPQVVPIFTNVPYPYTAPQNLKVGFAAATGQRTSFHEIRNVTVEVSSIDPILAPNPPNLSQTVCFNETLVFDDFKVSLPAQNQFIRCLQLYETNPGPPNNNPNPNGDPFVGNCGLSGVCVEKCKPENKIITVPGVGTFESILEDLTDQNFNNERNEADIKFTPVPGFFGTHTIFYTVIDNYGLTSEPRTLTVTVNPVPKIDSSGAIIGPTCNGQNDGNISNVVIKDLIPGFSYFWRDPNGNTIPASNYTKTETTVGSYIEATLGLNNINLGKYTLVVNNPATNTSCEDTFEFEVIDVRGTPVDVILDDQEVCQGTPVVFTPQLEDPTDAPNPTYLWWKNINKTPGSQITNGLTEGGVTYNITAPGILTITGLTQNATPYEYFVEVAADVSQNLCATPAGGLKRVQVLVLPPLNLSTTGTEDLCRQGTGQIVVTATGGFPTKTYSINGGPFQASNTFSNLLPGTYTIEVNAGSDCIGTISRTVQGPASAISITYLDQVNPSCGLNNGVLRFQVAGGTPNYSFTINGTAVTPTLAGGIYTVSGLAPAANYTVEVRDINSCPASFTSPSFAAIAIPTFGATDDVICPGETALLSPTITELSNATNLVYTWKDKNGNNLVNGGGVTYSVNSTTGELSIAGLAENAAPYEYTLVVSGTNICNNTPIPAKVTVNPTPKLNAPTRVNVTCFGENTGAITLNPQNPAEGANYEYSIDGGASFQASPVFNNLAANSYNFVIRNTVTGCTSSLNGVIITQPAELVIQLTKFIQAACGVPNGQLEVSFSGGTPGYKLELLLNGTVIQTSNSPTSPAVYSNLAPGDYQVRVTDNLNCVKTVSQTLINDVGIPITVAPMTDELCVGDLAKITPQVTTTGTPELKWYKDAAGTQEIISSATPDANGHVFTINSSTNELTVLGLKVGDYNYYLVAKGPGFCPNPPFVASVKVLQAITATLVVTDEICLGAKDGTITVNAQGADGNFEYSLNSGPFVSSNVFSALSPGTYNISVRSTGNNGCIFQATEVVKGPSAPISVNSPNLIRSSCDLPNGSIENLVISGGWGGYSVEWRKGSLSGPIVPGGLTGAANLLPDTYYLLVTDAKGCSVNFNFKIDEMPDPVFVVAPAEVCAGQNVILTPVNTVSGSAPTELRWYKDAAKTKLISSGTDPENASISYQIDSNGKLTISGLPGAVNPYTYYLEVVCTKATVSVDALVRIVPNLVFQTEPEICFGAKDGKISVSSGAISTFEYAIDGASPINQAQLEALTFAPKTYTITVTNGGLCSQSYQVKVEGPASAISINTPTILRSSCGLSNGSIENLVISGGWGSYQVEWRRGSLTGPVVTGDLTGAKNLAPDTYFVLIQDKEGCPASFSFVVTQQPNPNYVIAPVEVCAGQPVLFNPVNTVSGSAPTDFLWFKDAGKTQPISNGPDPANPAVIYSINPLSGALSITGLPGNSALYSFYLNVVCTNALVKADVLVRVVPAPVFNTEKVSCFGGNDGKILVQSGGDAKYTYSVDGGAPISEAQLEALTFAAKTYSIAVRNEGFCLTNFSVQVLQPAAALAVAPLTKIDPGCGADVGIIRSQITGGWAPYSVALFKNGSLFATQTIPGPAYEATNLSPGQYFIRITDAEGCVINSNTVTMVYGPTQVLVNNDEICEGETAILSPIANPIPTGAVFEWFKNSALTQPIVSSPTPDPNGHIFQIAPDGTLSISGLSYTNSPVTYYVRVSGGNSCAGFVASPQVVINRLPALSASTKDVICFGEKGSITLTGTAGNGIFTYSLDGTTYQSSNKFDVNPGTYTAYVKSGAGCLATVSNIIVNGPASALVVTNQTKQDASCNASDGRISFEISGGYNSSYTVLTKRNGVDYRTESVPSGTYTLSNVPSGNYSFTVTDAGGCVVSLPSSVAVSNLLTPLVANNDVICEGETAILKPSTTQTGINPTYTWYSNPNGTGQILPGTVNGVTYQIAPDGTLSISGLVGRQNPYLYYVKISGSGVCEPPLVKAEVLVYDIPNLRVSNPSIVCDPTATVDLTQFIEGFDPSIYDYQIMSPSGNLMRLDEISTVNQSGSYQVQNALKGSNCWSPNQRIQVLISEEELIPDFNYEADLGGGNFLSNSEAQILEKVNFLDNSLGKVIIWNWDFGDGGSSSQENPTHIYDKKGTYTVTLTTIDEIGCIAVTEKVITVLDDYVILVPNAFTPEGTKNQYFKPQFRGLASMEFYIFNTWGELIFESNSLETLGWDGTLNGKNAPNGNYVYRAVFETRSGEKVEKSGVFILIR